MAEFGGGYGAAEGWIGNNILEPAVNAGLFEPYNAAANLINGAGRHVVGQELLPKVSLYVVKEAPYLSAAYCAQTIASGLASAVPYALAGKLTGGALRRLGGALRMEGAAARLIASEKSAGIVGAAVYD